MPALPGARAQAPLALTPRPLPRRCRWAGRHEEAQQRTIQPLYSAKPYEYDRVPKRDERFPDPYNMGVNAEVFLYE